MSKRLRARHDHSVNELAARQRLKDYLLELHGNENYRLVELDDAIDQLPTVSGTPNPDPATDLALRMAYATFHDLPLHRAFAPPVPTFEQSQAKRARRAGMTLQGQADELDGEAKVWVQQLADERRLLGTSLAVARPPIPKARASPTAAAPKVRKQRCYCCDRTFPSNDLVVNRVWNGYKGISRNRRVKVCTACSTQVNEHWRKQAELQRIIVIVGIVATLIVCAIVYAARG